MFKPQKETEYNYNLVCNVKKKARPLVLNVKGDGYTIHHTVFIDKKKAEGKFGEPARLNFGEFFINERKEKTVSISNEGKFNFDFAWKRKPNRYIEITPDRGTVKKGESQEFVISYSPLNAHKLKSYKCQLSIVSGPKYDMFLFGEAKKPGIELSFIKQDFGPSFVMNVPLSKTAMLEMKNNDTSAITIETAFEKLPFLDVQLSPGTVCLPGDTL